MFRFRGNIGVAVDVGGSGGILAVTLGKRGGGSGDILERGGGSGGILRGNIAVDVAIVGRRGGGSRSILRGNVVAIDVAIDVAIIGCC